MRSVTVFSDLVGDGTRAVISADMEQNFWPDFAKKYPEITRGVVGSAESEQEFFQDIIRLYLTAFVMMYILLAIAFQSYSQPILLMMAIPFGFAGAVFVVGLDRQVRERADGPVLDLRDRRGGRCCDQRQPRPG